MKNMPESDALRQISPFADIKVNSINNPIRRGMKFNTVLYKAILFTALIFFTASPVLSGSGNGQTDNNGRSDFNRQPSLKLKSSPETKEYFKEAEKLQRKRNALFSLDFDVQLGVNIAKTNFELNKVDSTTQEFNSTSTRVGPSISAVLSLNLLGFGFTSGLAYSNKGFETSTGEKASLNYFNIPLLLYFDFNIGPKVRVDGNLGPYFGLLLSETNDPRYKVKNFDFGLTGNLQFTYMFNKYMGVLLGGRYEYGGLNNLGNNENFKRINTSTINIYTGLKFEL